MSATPDPRRAVIELLGDARLFDPQTFYGQNALKATLLRRTSTEYDWHFIGSSKRCDIDKSSARYHHVSSREFEQYLRALLATLGSSRRVPAFASFPVQSTEILNILAASPDLAERIALFVVLHCTAEELMPALFGGGQTPHTVAQTLRTVAPIARQFVYVSDAVRRSFARDEVISFFGDSAPNLQRSSTIKNAVDTVWLDGNIRHDTKKSPSDSFVIGSMAGFKPYKGRDIIVALLRTVQYSGPAHWRFSFAALPNYGTRDLLHCLSTEFADLVEAGRVDLFADVSQWIDVSPQIADCMRTEIEFFCSSLSPKLRSCFARCFSGILTEPAQAQFDIQIRPSLQEGFGRAVIEGLAIGVPVLASDRGALGELLPSDAIIHLPDSVSLAAALRESKPSAFENACADLGRAFHARISALETTERNIEPRRSTPHLDVDRMVAAYCELIDAA